MRPLFLVVLLASCGGAGARSSAVFVRDATIQGNQLVTVRCSIVSATEMRDCAESRSPVPVIIVEREVIPKMLRPRGEAFAKQLEAARETLTACARENGARGIVTLDLTVGIDGRATGVESSGVDLRKCAHESLWSVNFPEELGNHLTLSILVTP